MTSVQTGGPRTSAGWPPALEGVLALVEGSGRTAASVLSLDVQTWIASPEKGLAASIEAVSGAAESDGALARLSPSRLTVVAAVVSDGACWAEITRDSQSGQPETCIAGLTYDSGGAVARLVWLCAPLAPASSEVDEEKDAPGARPVLEQYFADLMSSRFQEAAAHFTTGAIYSHPPYAGGTERVLFRGREALWRGFVTERGPSPARQVITYCAQRGSRVFVEGVIEGIPDGGTFFSTAQITPEGKIARYVAFYSTARIPACG